MLYRVAVAEAELEELVLSTLVAAFFAMASVIGMKGYNSIEPLDPLDGHDATRITHPL